MQLIKKPNRWSCGLASFAMLHGIDIDKAVKVLGHDGSEILWPDAPEPQCRRAFGVQEFVDASLKLGIGLVQIDPMPRLSPPNQEERFLYTEDQADERLSRIMAWAPGLILGQYAPGQWHMCYWDREYVYDPDQPRMYKFDDVGVEKITIDTFWASVQVDICGPHDPWDQSW